MGTRHLIAVVLGGGFKIAQYGQWDGYPEGQGVAVLKFAQSADMEAFKAKLRELSWITEEQVKQVNDTPNWSEAFPHLTRDAGADVLTMVADADKALFLQDRSSFGGDSLFCEWAYVLDLDAGRLEVYRGFNKAKTAADSRFPSGADWLDTSEGYEPVRLVKLFDLKNLPNAEQFVSTLNDEDDAEINWGGQMSALVEQVASPT